MAATKKPDTLSTATAARIGDLISTARRTVRCDLDRCPLDATRTAWARSGSVIRRCADHPMPTNLSLYATATHGKIFVETAA